MILLVIAGILQQIVSMHGVVIIETSGNYPRLSRTFFEFTIYHDYLTYLVK